MLEIHAERRQFHKVPAARASRLTDAEYSTSIDTVNARESPDGLELGAVSPRIFIQGHPENFIAERRYAKR